MGFLDDAFKVGDSFVDRLGETLQDAGWVLAAPAATAVDLARAGFDKDVTVGGSLLTGFQRGTQLFFGDKNKGEQNLLSPGVGKAMDGLEWVYDDIIAPGAALGSVMGQRGLADIKGVEDNERPWWDVKSAWSETTKNRSSPGREAAYLWRGFFDSTALTDEGQKIIDDQSKFFDVMSGSIDFASRFFLDPTIVAGKAAKAARVAKVINRIDDPAEIASLLEENGGGLLAGFGKRHDAALDFIVQPTAAGKTRTATEIYAAFGGLQHSTDGAAISNLMENTVRNLRTKGFGDAQIKDQVKLISRAGMGDRTALKEIDGSVSEIKDALAQLYSSRSDLQKAADMAVASRPRVFVGGPGGLVEDVAARGEDYFASAEFIRLTDARLKAVQKDIRAAEQESARQEKLRIFFAPGKGSKYGSLADQPLLASAATASTKGLERRAAREAGEPARLDFVFQSSLW